MRGGRDRIWPGCTHPSLCVSRATRSAPGSKRPCGRRTRSPCAGRRSCWRARRGAGRGRSRATCAAPRRRSATASAPSTPRGLAALTAGSSRPKSAAPVLGEAELERLRAILHQPPRAFGHARSTWTLALLARVAHGQGLSPTVLSGETIRQALLRLGVGWKRAKRWLTSPDPAYAQKNAAATG